MREPLIDWAQRCKLEETRQTEESVSNDAVGVAEARGDADEDLCRGDSSSGSARPSSSSSQAATSGEAWSSQRRVDAARARLALNSTHTGSASLFHFQRSEKALSSLRTTLENSRFFFLVNHFFLFFILFM